MRMLSMRSTILLLACLGGCGPFGGEDAGGLAPGEASALNDAAAELDARNHEPLDGAGTNPAATRAAETRARRTVP